jgi:hypothetical protein
MRRRIERAQQAVPAESSAKTLNQRQRKWQKSEISAVTIIVQKPAKESAAKYPKNFAA